MKPSLLLVAASLLANIALIAALLAKPDLAPPLMRDAFARYIKNEKGPSREASAPAPATVSTSEVAANTALPFDGLWSRLNPDNLPDFVARLKAAGFPPGVIEKVVQAAVDARYGARLRALTEPDPSLPFWKAGLQTFTANGARYEAYSQLQRERSKLLRELLEGLGQVDEQRTYAQQQRFGELPGEKLARVQRIDDDYADMIGAVRAAANGVLLPADRATLALLAREKEADLAAFLSPEEIAEYSLRSSALVQQMRSILVKVDVSEAQFRAATRVQQELNERYPNTGAAPAMQGQDVRVRLEAGMKEALGEAGYRQLLRATSSEYSSLVGVVQRAGLPSETADRIYDVRDRLEGESARIVNDASLDATQRNAALQALAQTTRTQISAMLGPAAESTYLTTAGRWLAMLEKGSAVRFNGGINFYSTPDGTRVWRIVDSPSPIGRTPASVVPQSR